MHIQPPETSAQSAPRLLASARKRGSAAGADLVVFSHLRWDFVFQRPQHLLSRLARNRRVYYVEEPVFTGLARTELLERENGLQIVIPHLPAGLSPERKNSELSRLIDEFIAAEGIQEFTSWYYTPMALDFTRNLQPHAIVYDCMDELSAFKGAPVGLLELEAELLQVADVVFTGGQSLYEAKRERHHNIHAFPSSIDAAHFRAARAPMEEPADQAEIPGPRLGFFGVLDERFDIDLMGRVAALRPDWHFVMIGPVVKISPHDLPKRPNIHYLGKKNYQDLPQYLAGWDVALLPFARNESTRFISPTKTPEYLAAGKPVVSTSIRDVVRPYGENRLVEIADHPEEFVRAAERAMLQTQNPAWLQRVDSFLAEMCWENTCSQMARLEQLAREAASRAQFIVQDASRRLGA